MKRATDKLIALQFLAVVMPIAMVLLVQMAADANRAARLEHSRPLKILADEARTNYKTFMNGAADAVDTGTLGAQSVDALHESAARLSELVGRGEGGVAGDAAAVVHQLAAAIAKGATLATLMPRRDAILRGDRLTGNVYQEFDSRDEFVVQDAISSAVRQKRAVTAALVVTAILTVLFVWATRRRLKARIEANIAKERQRRAELETFSIRFGMATRAARAGVYELKRDGLELWWSDTMYELYAQPPNEFQPTVESWLALIHPDDRQAAQRAITGAMREHSQLRSQYRIVRADGSLCHVASLAAVATDSFDARPSLVGIDLDITDRVEAEERERDLQEQLRDASRQAGMAEIATNVLHNVGNVLNSVNISAGLVTERVKKPRVAGLGKVVALLKQHEADLGAFVSADERGRHLPGYLSQLSEHLLIDQQVTLRELESLRKNIDHIKEIVAMQQSYSKLVGVPERLAVAGLVDDALRMNVGSFTRHGVTLKCDFAEVPEIVVEKHKVLQILVNLLRNAKHACDASGKADKEIVVRIGNHAAGVQIAVADNGIGIQPEHMVRIFAHGFTTKKYGHGFGLHSGALAARDLGGALRVESAGPGSGATFTLELPLRSPEAAHG
ncbi:MAG: PAS domain-containing protein [Pseudomonadota bacterium]|nr:PAS domain-containing protein [Pseudomonadota bacterium]